MHVIWYFIQYAFIPLRTPALLCCIRGTTFAGYYNVYFLSRISYGVSIECLLKILKLFINSRTEFWFILFDICFVLAKIFIEAALYYGFFFWEILRKFFKMCAWAIAVRWIAIDTFVFVNVDNDFFFSRTNSFAVHIHTFECEWIHRLFLWS